jgi:hypothetical protein
MKKKELQRQIDELRERIALLEARPQWTYTTPYPQYPVINTILPCDPLPDLGTITCSTATCGNTDKVLGYMLQM